MINLELAKIFDEFAELLEILDVQWKPQAYSRAARELSGLKAGVDEIYKLRGKKGILEIPSVGQAICDKIIEYIETGKVKELDVLRNKVPKHLAELAKIPGIGAKRAHKLSDELKIKSIDDLRNAITANKISELPGFGEKSQKNISESLLVYEQQGSRKPYKEVLKIANKVKTKIMKVKGVSKVDVAGSLRRKKETIRDIDVLVVSNKPKELIDFVARIKGVKKILAKGEKKIFVLLNENIEMDVRVFEEQNYGAALLYFTGSKEFNVKMRNVAIKKGMKLNEYGLFDRKTDRFIAGKSEDEVFKKLGMTYVKPEERV